MDVIQAGEAVFELPDYAVAGSSIPNCLRTNRGRLTEWEVGATVGFVLSTALSYEEQGIPLGTLLAGHARSGQQARWNALQRQRQERYICAIIDGLYTQLALSVHAPNVTLESTLVVTDEAAAQGSCWKNTLELMADTWLQSCHERMKALPTPAAECSTSPAIHRLCQRLSRPPTTYEKDRKM